MPTHLVLVQSTPRPSSSLSPATFNAWYDTAHIPDLLQTPGIRSARRYLSSTTSPDEKPGVGSFPYLAVYPRVSREWLASPGCEFLKVPLHHEMLPGPEHFVFGVADFVMGAYEVVGRAGRGVVEKGAARWVVVQVLRVDEVEGREKEEVLKGLWEGFGEVAVRSVLLRYDFNPAGAGTRDAEIERGEVFVGARCLVLHELEELPDGGVGRGVVLGLLKAFGEVELTV